MAPEAKRPRQGDGGRGEPSKRPARSATSSAPAGPRTAYTPMFERFRDHMDAQQDRRERVVKASRDITALSKKMVRRIHPDLPADVDREVQSRLAEISRLLASIAPELQGIHRGRYGRVLFGMEELIEALTFAYYLRTQSLLSLEDAQAQVAQLCRHGHAAEAAKAAAPVQPNAHIPVIGPDGNDYIMGVFDLSGEMMRFATTTAALRGELASDGSQSGRTIVGDMQELGSFFEMLPQRHDKSWKTKMQVMQTSVQKVERLGYDLRVRGSERPKGWVPDATEIEPQSPV
ncbi:translin-associated factor [Grosmannia clavigera kw1407]|uniref:Translin-associated factor n=1 Tax=Grosmannia clavigera (strain kw1407 / UAMH 11150) TaxID=655863 RepID=F0XIS7_GROCL|nr:translin-associated factor [Grosmannia clavigera kw1407]EFX02269.1 translin-associated factor [Grosmannia clavigera kw1407]